ncbi:MAG: lipocalin-like domain-containing protein [Candidatus Amulumruptor caecigallinarius]|nr:lipocalin-like domain-containing protein [Candidatus Amulumruptor caecigallinarius]
MKKISVIIISAVLIVLLGGLSSCRRTSHNGKIDGFWRVTEVENLNTGNISCPEDAFICVNLELMQLQAPKVFVTGIMDYDKGGSRLGVDFRSGNNQQNLAMFGIYDNPVVFSIEHLSSSHMVLKTSQSVIKCEKF